MAVELASKPQRSRHAVHFYTDVRELVGAVRDYVRTALDGGAAAVLIATPTHRRAFDQALRRAGVDAAAARARGSLIEVDAAETLERFMVDGRPDALAFEDVVGGLIRTVRGQAATPAAYGEMVSLLWQGGNVVGALELEMLWNDLLTREGFTLYCSYPETVITDAGADALRDVCALHTEVRRDGNTHADPRGGTEAARAFSCSPQTPAAARRFTSQTLTQWGFDGVVEDVVAAVSELTTNAVLHARSALTVTISTRARTVRVTVSDASANEPRRELQPAYDAESGRGVMLVDALATRWGVEPIPGGKSIWAEFDDRPSGDR